MPRVLRPKLGPPPDGYWIGPRATRLNREPTQSYAGNGRACRSLTARGGGFLWIEDVPHRALAGQLLFEIALIDQGRSHLGRRQVRVPPRRLEFGIGVRVGFHDRADVGRQLWVLLFAASSASPGEVLPATHPVTKFVQSRLDGVASPAEASFGLAGATAAEFGGHLSQEQSALVSREASGPRPDQGVEALDRVFHGDGPA